MLKQSTLVLFLPDITTEKTVTEKNTSDQWSQNECDLVNSLTLTKTNNSIVEINFYIDWQIGWNPIEIP